MKYGAILKACRTRSGLSQEELAHKLFINQSDVSKYENGTKEPSISMVQAWTSNTNTQEVLVAFMCGVDGISIMQNILDAGVSIINTILLGGII
ncbi:helix-turn-helix domain-containing protein [Virgibacillus alimentarius]|uniref:helix-turn-helix domain-containing protein n=1 Tax=Virgibacillus alimentarius TaxID=698769 RepID=UPI000B27478D|nr:helix-turn-helix transcriptional regulator [Virgibacillus alimentarius]